MSAGDLERAGQALAGKLFEPAVTPEQAEVLERLETLLAWSKAGWTRWSATMTRWMPNGQALTGRSVAAVGSGWPRRERTEEPRRPGAATPRTRDAANLWAAVRATRGAEARDAAWHHPDLIPTSSDLDDPLGCRTRPPGGPDELDAELRSCSTRRAGGSGHHPVTGGPFYRSPLVELVETLCVTGLRQAQPSEISPRPWRALGRCSSLPGSPSRVRPRGSGRPAVWKRAEWVRSSRCVSSWTRT